MTILDDASCLIQAFLFRPATEQIEEFKPLGISFADAIDRLLCMHAKDRMSFVAVCFALHLQYQSFTLVYPHLSAELGTMADQLGRLFVTAGMPQYAKCYDQNCAPQSSHLDAGSFDTPCLFRVGQLLKFEIDKIALPDIESLLGALDIDAAKWLKNNCLVPVKMAIMLLDSIQNGTMIADHREISRFNDEYRAVLGSCCPTFAEMFLLYMDEQCLAALQAPISQKIGSLDRIAKGYLNPPWDWAGEIRPATRYAYEFLRTDKQTDVRGIQKEDLVFKGSRELSCFHSKYMNRLCGKLLGVAPMLFGTFPPILPEKLSNSHFEYSIKLNGIIQQSSDNSSLMVKEGISFCLAVNEALRMFNDRNLSKLDAVWIFRNRPDPLHSGYAGLLFAVGLVGLLRELPTIAIMDILKSGNRIVQCSLLIALGFSFKGQLTESIEKILSMHIRSHYLNSHKVHLSADLQGAALFSFGLLYYNSCDRQALKVLFTEFMRDDAIHEKTTVSYLPSFYLMVGCAIGLVSSGNLRNSLNDKQLNCLLTAANGLSSSDLQIPALVALMIGAAGTADVPLSNCISLKNKENVRPLFWFYMNLSKLLIEWNDASLSIGFSDEYSFYEAAAHFMYCALKQQSSVLADLLIFHEQLQSMKIESEGIQFKRMRMAIEFATDSCLISLGILANGSANGKVVNALRRHFGSTLDYNYGRSSIHSMALGFVCMQNRRLDLSNHFSLSALLISILPSWTEDFADASQYHFSLRYLWTMSCVPRAEVSVGKTVAHNLSHSTNLSNLVLYNAFTHNKCDLSCSALAKIFKNFN